MASVVRPVNNLLQVLLENILSKSQDFCALSNGLRGFHCLSPYPDPGLSFFYAAFYVILHNPLLKELFLYRNINSASCQERARIENINNLLPRSNCDKKGDKKNDKEKATFNGFNKIDSMKALKSEALSHNSQFSNLLWNTFRSFYGHYIFELLLQKLPGEHIAESHVSKQSIDINDSKVNEKSKKESQSSDFTFNLRQEMMILIANQSRNYEDNQSRINSTVIPNSAINEDKEQEDIDCILLNQDIQYNSLYPYEPFLFGDIIFQLCNDPNLCLHFEQIEPRAFRAMAKANDEHFHITGPSFIAFDTKEPITFYHKILKNVLTSKVHFLISLPVYQASMEFEITKDLLSKYYTPRVSTTRKNQIIEKTPENMNDPSSTTTLDISSNLHQSPTTIHQEYVTKMEIEESSKEVKDILYNIVDDICNIKDPPSQIEKRLEEDVQKESENGLGYVDLAETRDLKEGNKVASNEAAVTFDPIFKYGLHKDEQIKKIKSLENCFSQYFEDKGRKSFRVFDDVSNLKENSNKVHEELKLDSQRATKGIDNIHGMTSLASPTPFDLPPILTIRLSREVYKISQTYDPGQQIPCMNMDREDCEHYVAFPLADFDFSKSIKKGESNVKYDLFAVIERRKVPASSMKYIDNEFTYHVYFEVQNNWYEVQYENIVRRRTEEIGKLVVHGLFYIRRDLK